MWRENEGIKRTPSYSERCKVPPGKETARMLCSPWCPSRKSPVRSCVCVYRVGSRSNQSGLLRRDARNAKDYTKEVTPVVRARTDMLIR
jgi:hypothetical protein